MDAVEVAVRAAEANEADHYVGVGGLPNLLGEVELDASIMDGRTRAAGAVAGVRRVRNPIRLARLVMEKSPLVIRDSLFVATATFQRCVCL